MEIVITNEWSGNEESGVKEDEEIGPGDYIISRCEMSMVSPYDYCKYSMEENEEMILAKERWESSNG